MADVIPSFNSGDSVSELHRADSAPENKIDKVVFSNSMNMLADFGMTNLSTMDTVTGLEPGEQQPLWSGWQRHVNGGNLADWARRCW